MTPQDFLYMGCFLNRIAARYKRNPLRINPIQVLKDFYELASPEEHVEAFGRFCIPAMEDQFKWDNGSPANGLFYGQQLEILIEATFIIYKKSPTTKTNNSHQQKSEKKKLPMILCNTELENPSTFLEIFFATASLPRWKERIHTFTSAAISNSSVMDELSGTDIFIFINSIPKLIYAAHRLLP